MSDLSIRIKDYLASKKPKVEKLTLEVEVESGSEDTSEADKRLGYIIMAVVAVFMLYQAFQYGEVQNQCYLSKECREWIQNR